jgi:hypothetical protein
VPESLKTIPTGSEEYSQSFMSESQSVTIDAQTAASTSETEEITYQAVEKDGVVTAIWEMKGRKHLRTIDPRSRQGREILNLYTTEEEHHPQASEAATS